MSITIRPITDEFKVTVGSGKEKIDFFLIQLPYRTKSLIQDLTMRVIQGEISIDSSMTCFYNIKYGLKRVVGLKDEKGKPYKLRFENAASNVLDDECVDELLATPLSDNLQYLAMGLSQATFPDKILHPVTLKPLKGVTVVPANKLKIVKKKS